MSAMSDLDAMIGGMDGKALLGLYRDVAYRLRHKTDLPEIKVATVVEEDPDDLDFDAEDDDGPVEIEARCPVCRGLDLFEIDTAERWNTVAEDADHAVHLDVDLGESPDFHTLCWECGNCGAALQMPSGVEGGLPMIHLEQGRAHVHIDDLEELHEVAEATADHMAETPMPVADYVAGYAQGAADVLKLIATGGRERAPSLNMVLDRRRYLLGTDQRKEG